MTQKSLLVTGGAGFIGSNFVHMLAELRPDWGIVNLDALTYAGNLENLAALEGNARYRFVHGDVTREEDVARAFEEAGALGGEVCVVHFAAESHVDRSIRWPLPSVKTNVVGTQMLLDEHRRRGAARFLHVSTDEVYGSLGEDGLFTEETPLASNSPYSSSKAASDLLVRAAVHTHAVDAVITRCSNNYGPYQFPEKLIPLMIANASADKELPVYGDGGNVRDWLYVEDHCAGIHLALERGRAGQKYNIGGGNERNNKEVVERICAILDRERPPAANPALRNQGLESYSGLQTFVKDRPGHDRRYAIDATKIREELGWRPSHDFDSGLEQTVRWYLANREWCEAVQSGRYSRERLGLGPTIR
jgi:dTDP-glucose 4,6-dehydratase